MRSIELLSSVDVGRHTGMWIVSTVFDSQRESQELPAFDYVFISAESSNWETYL